MKLNSLGAEHHESVIVQISQLFSMCTVCDIIQSRSDSLLGFITANIIFWYQVQICCLPVVEVFPDFALEFGKFGHLL